MRKVSFWLAVAMAVAIAGSGAVAATSIWLSQDGTNGTLIPGNAINVAPNTSVTLYCFIESSSDTGNTFEIMTGYDKSDATTYGAGKDTNNGQFKKLTLTSTKTEIEGTIPTTFEVLRSAVLDASGREVNNSFIGGRPYGFAARGATKTNAAPGKKKVFSFTLENKMSAADDFQWVVISQFGGNSYSSAWKYGTALRENAVAYALKVVNQGSNNPTVGASNKAVLDAIMQNAADDYIWVLWGKVSNFNDVNDTFDIDDGSGVIIHVSAPGETVQNGKYVAVKGTLTLDPPTLTSQQVTKYN